MKKIHIAIAIAIILTGCSDKKDSSVTKTNIAKNQNIQWIAATKELSKEVRQCVLEGKPLLDIMSPDKLVQTCIEKLTKEKEHKKYQNINAMDR